MGSKGFGKQLRGDLRRFVVGRAIVVGLLSAWPMGSPHKHHRTLSCAHAADMSGL